MVTYGTIPPKMVNPGDIAGNAEEGEEALKKKKKNISFHTDIYEPISVNTVTIKDSAEFCILMPILTTLNFF